MPKFCFALILTTPIFAQPAYTIVETNAMFGQPVTMTVYRNGSQAVVDNVSGARHTRSLYDLAAHTQHSWDSTAPDPQCSNGTFGGDWGDPYAATGELKDAKPTGAETLSGVPTKIFEITIPGGSAKAWVDSTGLLRKLQMSDGKTPPRTMIEVTKVTLAAPPASIFMLPPTCAAVAPAPPPPSPDFVKAIMPPSDRKAASCTVAVRVMQGDPSKPEALQPITTGFKMRLGPATGATQSVPSPNGVLRIPNAADSFNLDVDFSNGASSALIYRQCFSPQTVLLLILRNPAKVTDGADWFWVKSDKFKP